ncbi:RdRP-domain-containing protein [Russula earlei]|uniref:RdRP-domain-containing protein n=1 Tax=Russula earlei TaxID=71964 RepID=A0ACC0TWV2_9AGAM|nr:RdRP-domain-containing protein [Russula earlei]
MELQLTGIDYDANIYDIYKGVELVLHGPQFHDPTDRNYKNRKPYFEIVPGETRSPGCPAGRTHNGTALLLVPAQLGQRLLSWYRDSRQTNNITVNGGALRLFDTSRKVSPDVEYRLEKAFYHREEQLRKKFADEARQVRLRVAKVQFGVWYAQPDSPKDLSAFSVEYEREYLNQSAAYISLVYEDNLICINIGQWETEEVNYRILVKLSSIRKYGIGYDIFRRPSIVFDLYTPPSFEQGSYNNRVPKGVRRQGRHKTRDRISALDDAHADIAPYAHQLRVILDNPDDLVNFERICCYVECRPLPTRQYRVDAYRMRFFRRDFIDIVSDWINSMEWKNSFQIEAYLRSGLLNTYDLLVGLQEPIANVIRDYGSEASDLFFRHFSVALRTRRSGEAPSVCLQRVRAEHPMIKPLKLPQGHILCHHAIITPSKILLEGPYITQSNRVIRRYQNHDPKLVERFARVEFRDENHLAYRWDGDVDGTWFLQQRIGGILAEGFEIGGRRFEFLAYSNSELHEHAAWFVSPFNDPVEGFVNAESIRASLGDFSELLRTPSKYAARIAQAFTATDHSVKIRRDQWDEQGDIGPHTDGVGTISSELADKIWEKCRAMGDSRENRTRPDAIQFRFLGYKGVVAVDSRLEGIKMRLRGSQRKFPVHDDEDAEFEIVRAFEYPNSVHLNRPIVVALEDLGVERSAFMRLQNAAKEHIYLASSSLKTFASVLRSHGLGDKFRLAFVLEQLVKLRLDLKKYHDKEAIGSAFLGRLVRDSINHSLREVKFEARIPVPHSYQLVGIADEGQAYIRDGEDSDKVFTLAENSIYVCVQEAADKEPVYFEGDCLITRSPVIHPGDVRLVYAVGKPPDDKICFFRGLKNVVVLPAVGDRSLASCLAGGDLDGCAACLLYARSDLRRLLAIPTTFILIIQTCFLLPPYLRQITLLAKSGRWMNRVAIPPPRTSLSSTSTRMLWYVARKRAQASTELTPFSHPQSLLENRHILIADQSKDGVFDEGCMKLAELCRKAVDCSKNGRRVDMRNLPKTLTKLKPDWYKAEVTGARESDYYVSERALGHLFREVNLLDANELLEGFFVTPPTAPLDDAISRALAPLVERVLGSHAGLAKAAEDAQIEGLHARYRREMRYICMTHTLIEAPDVGLMEEEVVLGTILANCTQPRWRKDRASRLRLQSGTLVDDIRSDIIPSLSGTDGPGSSTERQDRDGLRDGWAMWCWAQRHRDGKSAFIESFSLIALGVILDCLERRGMLSDSSS